MSFVKLNIEKSQQRTSGQVEKISKLYQLWITQDDGQVEVSYFGNFLWSDNKLCIKFGLPIQI